MRQPKRKRRGFTLVEVIVAFGILMMVASFSMVNISRAAKNMSSVKAITEDFYTIMGNAEDKMWNIREDLKDSTKTDGSGHLLAETPITYHICGTCGGANPSCTNAKHVKVTGYEVREASDPVMTPDIKNEVFTVVAENTVPMLPVPEVTKLQIGLEVYSRTENDTAYIFEAGGTIIAKLEDEDIDDPENVHFMTTYQWYISDGTFSTKHYPYTLWGPTIDYEPAGFYPLFPLGYEPVLGARGTTVTVDADMRGKHLILVATPVAGNGKMGTPFVSNRIFISALPGVSADPIYHFDASLMTRGGSYTTEGAVVKVEKWSNFSYDLYSGPNHAEAPTAAQQPELELMIDNDCSFHAVKFTGNETMTFNPGSASDSNATAAVFVVYKQVTVGAPVNTTLLQGPGWAMTTNGFQKGGSLTSTVTYNIDEVNVYSAFIAGGSSLFGVSGSYDTGTLGGGFTVGQVQISPTGGAVDAIAEIIIYLGPLTQAEFYEINDALLAKYNIE